MKHDSLSALMFSLASLLTACGPAPEAQTPPLGAAAASAAPTVAPTTAPTAPPVVPVAAAVSPAIKAVVDAADRSEADRKLDQGRHPAELFSFFGINPGMKVAELGAGGGYTAELLARIVGPSGVVYGQNNAFILTRFADKPWSERLTKPVMKNVVRVDREFDDPLPPEVKNLDAVFMVLFYHDTVWMKTDREKMNKAVFQALKAGGVFAVIDHSGRAGTGTGEAQTLHRIDEKVVRQEIEKAGFMFAAEAAILRNPADTRDWNDAPSAAADRRGTSDRFVYMFKKPGG